jgi:hypothetical protein
MPAFIVFQQNDDGSLMQTGALVEAKTRDAAVDAVRTTAGTFVAVLADGFRPRTYYAAPKPPAAPKPTQQQGGQV